MANRIASRALELRRLYGGDGRALARKEAPPRARRSMSTRPASRAVEVRVPGPFPKVSHEEEATQWAAWLTLLVGWRDRWEIDIEGVLRRLGERWEDAFREGRALTDDEWADLLAGLGLGRRPLSRSSIPRLEELLREHGPVLALLPAGIDGEDIPAALVIGLKGDGSRAGTYVRWIEPRSGEVRRTGYAVFAEAFGAEGPEGERREVLLWPPKERLADAKARVVERVPEMGSVALNYAPDDDNNPAELRWKQLELTRGSSGREHLYYLVTGGPSGRATFHLEVTNNSRLSLRDQRVSISLKDVKRAGEERIVPLERQSEGAEYHSWTREGSLGGRSSEPIEFYLDRSTLERAYDPDHPLTRIDAEYRFVTRVRAHGYQTTSLGFYLVEPANLMWRDKRYEGEVRLDDPRAHFEYWVGLAERRFAEEDRAPIRVTGTIRYSRSTSESEIFRADVRVSESTEGRRSREVGVEVGGQRARGASLSLPLKKIFDLGIEANNQIGGELGYSSLRETLSSRTEEFLQSVARSSEVERSLTREQEISTKLEPGRAGELRRLYAYPIFNLYRMPLVTFLDANAHGQATHRHVIEDFPVLTLSHWGYVALGEEELPEPDEVK